MTQVDPPNESVPTPDGFVAFSPAPPTDEAEATEAAWSVPVTDVPEFGGSFDPSVGTAPLQYPAAVPPAPDAYGYAYGYGQGIGAPAPRSSKGLRTGPVITISVILALLAGLIGGVLGFALADQVSSDNGVNPSVSLGSPNSSGTSERPADSIAGIASKALPTVVSLSVRSSRGASSGSGFIIQSDGYILTNNHVIEGGIDAGTVRVAFEDGSSELAVIVGRDSAYDLAVLKVEKTGLPVMPLGNSDEIAVGDAVLAVGSPLGLTGTVTTGIVSALNRPVTAGGSGAAETSFLNAIQTDAAINPGNSGGPLVNSSGAAIGVNSAIATLGGASNSSGSIGVGFAIPINQARRTAEEIIQTGKSTKPVIGVTLDLQYDGPGAKIASDPIGERAPITPGGPADKAGLKPGDVVLAVNGRAVNGGDELIVAIRIAQPGDTVTMKVQRGSTTTDIKVVLGSESSPD